MKGSLDEAALCNPEPRCLLWGVAASGERSSINYSTGTEADAVVVVRVATLGGVFGEDGGNPNAKLCELTTIMF